MVVEKIVFEDVSEDLTSSNDTSNLDFLIRIVLPSLNDIESRDLNTLRDEDTSRFLSNMFKRTLNPVENVLENTWSKFN